MLAAGKLQRIESESESRPRIMTRDAFRAAWKMPRLARCSLSTLQRNVLSFRIEQFGIGLLVVPNISVTAPLAALRMENLRFESFSMIEGQFHLDRDRLAQNRVFRRKDVASPKFLLNANVVFIHFCLLEARECDEPNSSGSVHPSGK